MPAVRKYDVRTSYSNFMLSLTSVNWRLGMTHTALYPVVASAGPK